MTQPIMSPTSGDVVLPAQQGKKKKVGLIIGVILILIAIGAGVAAVMLMGKGKDSLIVDYTKLFNVYANYLLYGSDNDEPVDFFVPSDTFYIDENYNSPEYISSLKESFDNFYNSVEGKESLQGVSLSLSEERIDFLVEYSRFDFIDFDSIRGVYENQGFEVAKQTIYQFYGLTEEGPSDSENEIMYEMKQADAERVLLLLDSNYESDIGSSLFEAERYLSSIIDSSISVLKRQCLGVYNVIKDENED